MGMMCHFWQMYYSTSIVANYSNLSELELCRGVYLSSTSLRGMCRKHLSTLLKCFVFRRIKSKSENVQQSCSWSTRKAEGCISIISVLNYFLQMVKNSHIMPKDTSESEEVKQKLTEDGLSNMLSKKSHVKMFRVIGDIIILYSHSMLWHREHIST